MPKAKANELELHYEEHGDPAAPAMLLIMGVGAQLTLWPIELIEALASEGFRVIRFDNRDIGLSQKLDHIGLPNLPAMIVKSKLRLPVSSPYSLGDMADDAIGLLDALEIDRAHVIGASMGGMIAQQVALRHAERALSLTSIMSTTGSRSVPAARRDAIKALTTRPATTDVDALVEHGVMVSEAIGSPGYPGDPDRVRSRVRENIERSVYPDGFVRQMAAIIADGDRSRALAKVDIPTLVLHGEDDPLVRLEGGKHTAASIPNAVLKTYPGMGHDFPLELIDSIAAEIADHARSAEAVGR